jgi:methylenetetrahydrofolate dehydrogenase (NADP+)/methenyltetrahydrofolate cyclohydrolase
METGSATVSQIIDGTSIAAAVREEVAEEVRSWTSAGHRSPFLAVVLVGDNPASASYVRGKATACRHAGFESDTLTFPDSITEAELISLIEKLNRDSSVDGILVQLPLPRHINENLVVRSISPDKDVDGFHPASVGALVIGQPGFVSATPAGILELLKRSNIETRGKHAVIIGRSNIVGKPLANLLLRRGVDCTVTVCHSQTENLGDITRTADILVAAIGRAGFVTADMVRAGATVIDVGINRVDDANRERGYRLVGDVDFDGVSEVAGYITPVPGGVGPMTIAMLLRNTLTAAKQLAAATGH